MLFYRRSGLDLESVAGGYRISVGSALEAKEIINKYGIEDFEFVKGRMDDVFLAATGTKSAEEEK